MDDDDDDGVPWCEAHVWSDVDSDGRQRCGGCGAVMPRHMDPEDCMDCGVCDWCVERSMDAADEAAALAERWVDDHLG